MGVRYVRMNPLVELIEINEVSKPYMLLVENIFTDDRLGNELLIHLRQPSDKELEWVTITQGSPTSVEIDPFNPALSKTT